MKINKIYVKKLVILSALFLSGCNSQGLTQSLNPPTPITPVNTLQWSKQVGNESSGSSTEAFSTSTDTNGNIYVAGETNTPLAGNDQHGVMDYFISKHDSTGAILWIKQLGGGGVTVAYGADTDNAGNVYVVGQTDQPLTGQTQHGTDDYFVSKYDTNGNVIWIKQLGLDGWTTHATGVSTDSSGNIYLVGTTSQDGGPPTKKLADYVSSCFISKYDSNGNLIWTKNLGNGGNTQSSGISTDTNGNIYIDGSTNVPLNGQTQHGGFDYFVSKYDASGDLIWLEQTGGSSSSDYTQSNAVSADSNGNVYVVGQTRGALDGQKQYGDIDYFIAKYNNNGALTWTQQLGAMGGTSWATAVSTDYNGNIYLAGNTSMALPKQTQFGKNDSFLARYTPNGSLVWIQQLGIAGGQNEHMNITLSNSESIDSKGNVYVAGGTSLASDDESYEWQKYLLSKYAQS